VADVEVTRTKEDEEDAQVRPGAPRIRDHTPQSVAELVALTGRAQPNLTRTVATLEAAGFVTMKTIGRRRTPSVAIKKIVVEIDPYSERDRLRVA